MMTPLDYGAVPDDPGFDNYGKLVDFINAVSNGPKAGHIPAMKFYTSQGIVLPAETMFTGIPYRSAIVAMPGLTGPLCVGSNGTIMDGFDLDGAGVALGNGLSVGESGLVTGGVVRNVRSYGFTNGAALRLAEVVSWRFDNPYFGNSEHGIYSYMEGAGVPTNCLFTTAKLRENSKKGALIRSGYGLVFDTPAIEGNGEDGIYADSALTASGIPLLKHLQLRGVPWFEGNWLSDPSNPQSHYHGVFRNDVGTRISDAYLSPFLSEPKAFNLQNSVDFIIDAPRNLNAASQIFIDANSHGRIINWPSSNGDLATVVNDVSGRTINKTDILTDFDAGTWVPVDASGAGMTFGGVGGRWTSIGRMVFCQFDIQFPTTSNGSGVKIGWLPFATAAIGEGGMFAGKFGYNSTGRNDTIHVNQGQTSFALYGGATAATNANYTQAIIRGTVIYYRA